MNKIPTKGLKKVGCGDWHRSWGLGTNHIGKLAVLDNGYFLWFGHCQGRHGQTWGKGQQVLFSLDEATGGFTVIDRVKDGTLPDVRDVRNAVTQLTGYTYKSWNAIA